MKPGGEETLKGWRRNSFQINENISALNDKQTLLEEELNQIPDELSGKDQKLRDTQVLYHQDKIPAGRPVESHGAVMKAMVAA